MSNYVRSDRTAEAAAQQATEGSGTRWLPKLAVGDTLLRTLPPHTNMINPQTGRPTYFIPVCLHYQVGPAKRVVPCPRRMDGGYCPQCELGFDLIKRGYEKQGKELLPSWSMNMNVLVMDKAGQPVRNKAGDIEVFVWSCPRGVMEDIQKAIEERESELNQPIDISDPEQGYVLKINREGTKKEDTKYRVYLATKATSIMDFVEYWDAGLVDVTDLNPMVTADQIKALMAGRPDEDPFADVPTDRPRVSAPEQDTPPEGLFDDTVDGEFTELPFGGDEPAGDPTVASGETPAERLRRMASATNGKGK